jgi:hypothetical protein
VPAACCDTGFMHTCRWSSSERQGPTDTVIAECINDMSHDSCVIGPCFMHTCRWSRNEHLLIQSLLKASVSCHMTHV